MTEVRKAIVGTATVVLEARDRYNDYSVVHDYLVSVRLAGDHYGREFYSGTNKSDALELFEGTCRIVRSKI